MKIYNITYKDNKYLGIEEGQKIRILSEKNVSNDMITFIKNNVGLCDSMMEGSFVCDFNDVNILAPIEKPIHDIICVGKNYIDHVAELKNLGEKEIKATYFGKRANKIVGPKENIKGNFDLDDCIDYEVELAVIIGKTIYQCERNEVYDAIWGYSIFNDLSSRTLQKEYGQWYRGKSLDNYSIMGPCIVTKDEIEYPLEVEIESRVNGELRQNANTRDMISTVETIIYELAQGMTLEAGDIIATGTPKGVGMGFNPPRYLKEGDIVECSINKIGSLKNKIIS